MGSKICKEKKRLTGKRGRKNVENDRVKISFEPDQLPCGWKIPQQSSSSKRSTLIEPSISELTILLSVTYEIMNGGAIQSNLIESKNSVIRDILPDHGLKGVHQYDYLVGTYLFANKELKCDIFSQPVIKYEPRSSLGFYHMFDFFIPDPKQIEIY